MSFEPRQSVITRTPLRISLGGGGTDLPFYSSRRGGFLISAAIDEYFVVSIASRSLDDRILVQTTAVQFADSLDELENQLVKATLQHFGRSKAIQVGTFTTVPTGIGLGSSSTQIVGMVNALAALEGRILPPLEIALVAHHIERKSLGFAGGVQDQYISALGGIQVITVARNGTVKAEPLNVPVQSRQNLERHLVLVSSGKQRNSADVIKSQEVDLDEKVQIYDGIKEIGQRSLEPLVAGDVQRLGELMDEHWRLKKRLSRVISSSELDRQYEELKAMGSPGGKIVGAGGGGFFMMAVPGDVPGYLRTLRHNGYRALLWRFDFEGTHIISHSLSDDVEVA
jgi:D-glycero-alpha-D-manno-heptose-7-phosphate kinase